MDKWWITSGEGINYLNCIYEGKFFNFEIYEGTLKGEYLYG